MKKVFTASGQPTVDLAISKFDGYEVIGRTDYKEGLLESCLELKPDILVAGEALGGEEYLAGMLLKITQKLPETRIVYIPGHVNHNDEVQSSTLALLLDVGITDIITEAKVSEVYLKSFLDNPRPSDELKYLKQKTQKHLSKVGQAGVRFVKTQEFGDDEDESVLRNLFAISSIKPGTGKSFLSTNIATAIAEFGILKNGKKPRVALIEADLQNLSVGTLLAIQDDKKNLKSVMDRILKIVSDNGEVIGSDVEVEDCEHYILSAFKSYKMVKNLHALVGSQLKYEELSKVKPAFYAYLMSIVAKHYDIVIVDSNSSLGHVTTAPILTMAKNCFYVLNLDFNNVNNNLRYRGTLEEMGIKHKVKYILNEDIKNSDICKDDEELIFTADNLNDSELSLAARIPMLSKNVFLNRLYEGIPVVLDKTEKTLEVRLALMKTANQVYPIEGIDVLEKKLNEYKSRNKKKRFGLF